MKIKLDATREGSNLLGTMIDCSYHHLAWAKYRSTCQKAMSVWEDSQEGRSRIVLSIRDRNTGKFEIIR